MNFAIIGCGRIAPRHAQALQIIPDTQIVGVCDVVEKRAANYAQTYGGEAYTDYHRLLEREDIDIVSICVPSGLHVQIGLAAAKAGKNILMEKPIALNVSDADQLIDACNQAGVTLGCVLQNRFNPPMQELRKLADEGGLGG